MRNLDVRGQTLFHSRECTDPNCKSASEMRDKFRVRQWLQHVKNDPLSMAGLRKMLAREVIGANLRRIADDDVIEVAAHLLSHGVWHAHSSDSLGSAPSAGPSGGGSGAAPDQVQQPRRKAPPPPAPGSSSSSRSSEEKTWFRMKLLDEDGDPMAGEDYIVVDSAGARRQGKLDSNGEFYIPSILPKGDCTVNFPNIHLNPRKRKK